MRIVRPINMRRIGEQRWKLNPDYVFADGDLYWRVRGLYEANGNSTPALAKWYLPPAAVPEGFFPHDACYQYHRLERWTWNEHYTGPRTDDFVGNELTGEWKAVPVSRAQADRWFRETHEHVIRTRWSKAKALWDFLRLGGWIAWYKKTCDGDCACCPCNAAGWCPYMDLYAKPDKDKTSRGFIGYLGLLILALLVGIMAAGCGLLRNADGTPAYQPAGRAFNLELSGLGCAFKFGSSMTAQPAPSGSLRDITPEQLADALVPQIRQAILNAAANPPAKKD